MMYVSVILSEDKYPVAAHATPVMPAKAGIFYNPILTKDGNYSYAALQPYSLLGSE